VTPRTTHRLAAIALAVGLTGCRSLPWGTPAHRAEWSNVHAAAQEALRAGRYADADSTLEDYQRRRPRTPGALDALYLRALFRLDPANPDGSPGAAVQLLDEYLADSTAPRALEAGLVRRAAVASDSLERQVTSLRVAIDAATGRDAEGRDARDRAERDRGDRSRQQELQRLRDELSAARTELASTKEELDRIKKRLATPRP